MTDQQRKILIGVGGAVALVALLVVLVLVTGGDDDDDLATGDATSTTASSTTSTTQDLDPVTSATTSTTTSTTAAPPPSTAPPPPPPLDGRGAVLQRPSVAAPRTFDDDEGCESLADRGPWEVECEVVAAGDTELAWMVGEHRGTGALRAYVFRRLVGNQWTPVLAAADDDAVELAGIVVRVEDVSRDGRPDLVFGFRHQGTGQILELDVVEGPGRVTLHRELDKGTARVAPGQLEDWTAQFGPEDANCCPSSFLHTVIRFDGGAWRAVAQEQVAPDSQPPGDF